MENINYLAVIGAGLAAWLLGALWYSPLLFGKSWQNETGLSDEEIQGGNMALTYGLSALLMVVMMFGLMPLMKAHPAEAMNFGHGAFHGAMVGLFFAATSIGINYLYQRKSIKLWLIDGVYQVAFLALGGGILGAFA